ncbi:MAG: hypothetical protein R3200_07790 [Xanthomonadales bacterium]|nr:hypothetical protein [Xanthomonadales bacterium]
MRTILILIGLLLAAPHAIAEVDCAALFAEHLETDLGLSYHEFDQTPRQGFRSLAGAGCPAEAADLIERYIEETGATEGSLMWHIAQLRAVAGDYEAAIAAARRCIREDDTGDFRWNDYVYGTIAFLQRDRQALIRFRDAVAAGVDDHHGNAMNVRLLNAMVEHFDEDYAYATSQVE